MKHLVFDIESTSADPNTCRIVQLAIVTLSGDVVFSSLVNPCIPIPPGATKIHGITDGDVKDAQPFASMAEQVEDLIEGAALCGYHSRKFDVPVLDRELRAAGRKGIDLATVVEIDAHQCWIEMSPRTLVGAVKEFCGEDMEGAHDAVADAQATARVINAMVLRYEMAPEGLADASKPKWEIDRAGKFKRDEETGRALLAFGKHRGAFAAEHQDFLKWMLSVDFPEETKRHIRTWLGVEA